MKAFEAASRHRSFRAAADELHLTQSAISHQVKVLEDFLEVSLFRRHAQGVELTDAGKAYADELTRLLDSLAEATNRTGGVHEAGCLRICATPAFLSRWLLPRVTEFNRTFPDIELELETTGDPTCFPSDGTDILIQYGPTAVRGLSVEPFLHTTRFPVCAPALLEQGPAIRSPEDIAGLPLLRDMVGDDWETWFECATGARPEGLRGSRLAHCDLTLRAAEEGLGVVLAYGALIEDELSDGRLVRLSDIETPPKVIYSLACPLASANHPRTAAFRNWVFEAVSKQSARTA